MYKFLQIAYVLMCSAFFGAHEAAVAQASDLVFLEDLTSPEVRNLIASGRTTIILPTGGTEQNGPHMVLGKHNYIVKYAAEQIASKLGNTLVAPVLAYVPEGQIEPPTGHMQFPGTISLPEEYFVKVIEFAARSFKASGFKDIVLIGDSGGNQKSLQTVATLLNKEWRATTTRVHFVADYYDDRAYVAWLKKQGESSASIGNHAGISDTSQLLAIRSQGVRVDKLIRSSNNEANGVSGDPARARVDYGRKGLELKINQAVAQIRVLISEPRN
jgi:creatinine amidohydrolase